MNSCSFFCCSPIISSVFGSIASFSSSDETENELTIPVLIVQTGSHPQFPNDLNLKILFMN